MKEFSSLGVPTQRRVPSFLSRKLHLVDIPASKHVDALTEAGMSRQFAESFAELLACLASGRVSLRGDRVVTGTTQLEDILPVSIPA